MALKAVAASTGGSVVGAAGALSVQLSNAAGGVVDGTYYLAQTAPFDFTMTGGKATVGSGYFTMVVKIGATTVAGSSQTIFGATTLTFIANNVVVAGDVVTLVVTGSTGNPPNAAVEILFTRNSL